MKAAIYCRLSEEDKNKKNQDSESIQNQKALLLEYALNQNWDVFGIYSDDDYAGADRNRPEWNRLLNDAENRKFDVVLCKTQSRFTRELEMVEKYIHGFFTEWGIRFISIVDNADTANEGNKKSRQINGLVNEWYLEDNSKSIKAVLDSKRKQGVHIGAFARYGYEKAPERKGHLIIDPEAAEVVREVFELFARGHGKVDIARILNERGLPNPTEYKRLKGLRFKNNKPNRTLWKYSAIASMLTDEVYIGNMVQGKYGSVSYKSKKNKPRPKSDWFRVEGTHEAIIPTDLWDNVQLLLKQKAKPFKVGTVGVFAGKIVCADCGYVMRSGKSREIRYFKCETKHHHDSACSGAYINLKKVEELVLNELKRMNEEYLDTDYLEQNIEFHNRHQEKLDRLKKEINVCEQKIVECGTAIRNLYVDKVKGLINDNDFVIMSKGFSDERAKFEKIKTDNSEKIAELELQISESGSKLDLIERYINVTELDRITVDNLIESIVVEKKKDNCQNVTINWRF